MCIRDRSFSAPIRSAAILLALSVPAVTTFAAPVVPGIKHPDSAGAGELLISELNCTACHSADAASAARLGNKPAPNLAAVGERIAGSYLAEYLSNPHGSRPGTTMPDVLSKLPANERNKVAGELAAYLGSLGKGTPQNGAIEAPQIVLSLIHI